jgi:phosphoadenosine phosphosulfate reductase
MPTVGEQLDLAAVNARFEKAHPPEVIDWTLRQFGTDVVMSSSFGAESAVLIHLATRLRPEMRIIFVDTGYLFPETYQFMERLRHRLGLNIWTYRTRHDPIAWLRHAGEENPQWRKNVDACCAANKFEPMERAMRELAPKAWLRGIRRHQNDARGAARFVEMDSQYGCYAVSPLLNWSARELHAYLQQHDLPYNPLVDQGYLSIGCNPLTCTRPVKPGEDARAGRWAGQSKTECGINLGSLDEANQI